MAVLNNSNAISSGGYDINNSVRLRSSASAYLNRTPASAGNRTTWTWSAWVKRGSLSVQQAVFFAGNVGTGSNYTNITFNTDNTFTFENIVSGVGSPQLITTQVFRDPSAWYHIVAVYDSTQATSSNRAKLYINGTQVTAFGTATYPSLNQTSFVNSTEAHLIGASRGPANYFDGYLTEQNFIDGQALTPSSFGETDATTGSWKPKPYSGTYGTNGFYLKFSDIAQTVSSNVGLGKDFSGNTNYWVTNNIYTTSSTDSQYDAMTDVPTLTSATVANYAVLNPIRYQAASALTYSEANLRAAHGSGTTSAGGVCAVASTMSMTSGKWYFEFILNSFYSNGGSTPDITFGINNTQSAITGPGISTGWGIYGDGSKYNAGSTASYGNSFTTNDIIGVAVDMDNGKIWFSKNGTWQTSGDPAAGTNAAYTNVSGEVWAAFGNSTNSTAYNYNATANFGQRPFTYTPPTGFVALNTFNLPDSTIKKGNTVMDATLYTGTGASLSVTNASAFKPDFVWAKGRSGATDHALYDSVRGVQKQIESNNANAETTETTGLTAFNSNGFTVGALAQLNTSTATYVGWQWQAGQGSTSSNTSGSITSTVSVNATAGFSVVTYTGTGANATVGHGLGVAPKMIIVKDRTTATNNFQVYHASIGNTTCLRLNLTNASAAANAVFWNNTSPTSSVFSLGTYVDGNQSGDSFVAYCWAEIAGFSAFGSYTGNGSADGPFIYLGFRPKFIITKMTSGADEWITLDSARSDVANANTNDQVLVPNSSAAESSGSSYGNPLAVDFLSNGFKIRGTQNANNNSGSTFIYMAFASNPFKNSNAF